MCLAEKSGCVAPESALGVATANKPFPGLVWVYSETEAWMIGGEVHTGALCRAQMKSCHSAAAELTEVAQSWILALGSS